MQHRAFKAIDLKAADDSGIVIGRASTYDNVPDAYGDVVARGAFTKTLQDHGGRFVVLSQHDPTVSIGIADLVDKADGLHFRAQLLINDVQAAREDYARAKAGVVSGVSIGYETIRDEVDRKTGVRRLLEVRLAEISLVTFPANTFARVTSVKRQTDNTLASLQRLTAEMRMQNITAGVRELTALIKANRQRARGLHEGADQLHTRFQTRGHR